MIPRSPRLPEPFVTDTPNLCTICEATLSLRRGRDDVLCGSLSCASAYRAVPDHLKCGVCGRVIPPAHRASRHCGRYACAKIVAVDRPQAAARAAHAALVVSPTRSGGCVRRATVCRREPSRVTGCR